MWLVHFALRRPITIVIALVALVLTGWFAGSRMKRDIFPNLGVPTIYVAQPYGGMDPSQMEGYLTYYFEYHFLYIAGIAHIESKSIQGAALLKLQFHPETDMSQAMSQVIGYVNRARAFMPPGTVPPFVTRFDAGSFPIAQLVFTAENRTPGELQDFALNRVRPLFATLPGVSAPPPFGGNQKTLIVRLDPNKLRQYRISPEQAIQAVSQASTVLPSGNVRIGTLNRIASTNAAVNARVEDLAEAPVLTGPGLHVYVKDIGSVEVGTDILSAYAHVNGKRTVYIPVTKRADASTLDVLTQVRNNLPAMQAVLPDDVKVSMEFDQSGYVVAAIKDLVKEGLLGALLTALVVIVFLRDWRGALVVLVNIPAALLAAVTALYFAGQTINVMTLGGLALAVGLLVDEATVEIENFHASTQTGISKWQTILDACRRTANARFLSTLSILAVFISAVFMTGAGKQLFVPLALSVGFAMLASYILSSTLVPVLAGWLLKPKPHAQRSAWQDLYGALLQQLLAVRWLVALLYLGATALVLVLILPRLSLELFPQVDSGQYRFRLRAPTGTRIEETERITLRVLDRLRQEIGQEHIDITTSFVGVHPASYPINTIYLFTSGPQEALVTVALKPTAKLKGQELQERIRAIFAAEFPQVKLLFEPGDLVSDVMSFGSAAPVEVAVQGPNLKATRDHALVLERELKKISDLRDLQYAQVFDYPTLDIEIDRDRAGQFGLTAAQVGKSLVAATSSSRFTDPNYWRDPGSGNAFQIQVEIPQNRMASMDDVAQIPVMRSGAAWPLLADVANIKQGQAPGLVERFDGQRVVTLIANHRGALGDVANQVQAALSKIPTPKGLKVSTRGQIPALVESVSGLRVGLLVAILAIFLLLSAALQSIKSGLVVLLTIPGTLLGVILLLWLTGSTLNIQSFIGTIMATGIAVANSILLVTFARQEGKILNAAVGRIRAVIMTATAMIAGTLPMMFAVGTAQAPLGRAVIGGLIAATLTTLLVLPCLYRLLHGDQPTQSPSMDPTDPESLHHEPTLLVS
jgi:multidrug efflux pump subunit AcrB